MTSPPPREPAWSAEAVNACWTNGWKRPQVTDAVEQALEENVAKVDYLANTETAVAVNNVFMKTRTTAMEPSLTRIPKNAERGMK